MSKHTQLKQQLQTLKLSGLLENLDRFSRDGYFLKSYHWDWEEFGLIEHVDKNGYFYTNRGDSRIVPGVTKWKVAFE